MKKTSPCSKFRIDDWNNNCALQGLHYSCHGQETQKLCRKPRRSKTEQVPVEQKTENAEVQRI